MFCTECGTKLEDGATFCTNCGYKIPAEAAVATMAAAETVETPAATPVAEPVQSASQSMYTEPAQGTSQSMYTEPAQNASQSMYSQPAQNVGQSMYSQPAQNAGQSMYSQPAQNAGQSMYSQPDSATAGMAYGASQGYNAGAQNPYGTQNTYNAQQTNASYNYNSAPQPQKKKGKGCLIAALIGGGILIIGIIVVIIAIIAGVSMLGSDDDYDYSYDDDYSYSYDYEDDDSDDYDDSIVPDELDDMMDDADDYDYVPASGEYDLYDIYGEWEGTSTLVSVSGADEMQEYLEGLIGRPLTEDEIAGLNGTNAEEEWFGFNAFAYDAAGNGVYEDGFWELWLNMGSYFDEEYFDIYDAMTYDQYMDDDYSTAAIKLDSNNCFEIEVMERDYYGEYGCQFFDAYDYDVQEAEVEEDGAYGFVINGQVVDGEYGPEIHGEMVVMFQYGDMEEPYGMAYEYVLTDFYDVY
ncbi:MAG: zinc-ribbon domain-containing protein [Lachnospiraceae bacterium]|nr:zinc-ribbon domain-containing protein [Lachnospiraceae bacterium]